MKALILSCSIGGGHNAAASALKEELVERGHSAVMLDPYALVSDKLAEEIGQLYTKMIRRSPHVYGMIYSLGGVARKVPGQSPIYYANVSVAKKLEKYLRLNEFDIIIMTHIYPAELITYLKKHQVELPTTVYVATDYLCIPYTEETDCDYYIVPSEKIAKQFVKHKIPKEKVLPLGIPVRKQFETDMSKGKAREILGLDKDSYYILISGGTLGIGKVRACVKRCLKFVNKKTQNCRIIVVCGSNERLYKRLSPFRGEQLTLLQSTKLMGEYMRACDLFISKPGGMAATEAATVGIPTIITTPIPGCEKYNMKYFRKSGMAIGTRYVRFELPLALKLVENPEIVEKMQKDQQDCLVRNARTRICNWIEDT